jgi:hypothetical protein
MTSTSSPVVTKAEPILAPRELKSNSQVYLHHSRASTNSPYDMSIKLSPTRGADSGYMGSPQSTGSPIYTVNPVGGNGVNAGNGNLSSGVGYVDNPSSYNNDQVCQISILDAH